MACGEGESCQRINTSGCITSNLCQIKVWTSLQVYLECINTIPLLSPLDICLCVLYCLHQDDSLPLFMSLYSPQCTSNVLKPYMSVLHLLAHNVVLLQKTWPYLFYKTILQRIIHCKTKQIVNGFPRHQTLMASGKKDL